MRHAAATFGIEGDIKDSCQQTKLLLSAWRPQSKLWSLILSLTWPRTLFKEMLERVDKDAVRRDGQMLDGGDIRCKSNQWVRSAFLHSGLHRVPRESQVRAIIEKICSKKGLCGLDWKLPFQ